MYEIDFNPKNIVVPKPGWHLLTDMICCSLKVNSIGELWDAYSWFKESGMIDILNV